jgi:hypothetical protein
MLHDYRGKLEREAVAFDNREVVAVASITGETLARTQKMWSTS